MVQIDLNEQQKQSLEHSLEELQGIMNSHKPFNSIKADLNGYNQGNDDGFQYFDFNHRDFVFTMHCTKGVKSLSDLVEVYDDDLGIFLGYTYISKYYPSMQIA